MKLINRDNILAVLDEMILYLEKNDVVEEDIINENIEMFVAINELLCEGLSEEEYQVFLDKIDNIQSMWYDLKEGKIKSKVARKIINGFRKDIKEIKDIQYTVVFIPYNASMWDCFDSVWRTAKQDPNCTPYVLPIPYYTRDYTGEFVQQFYTADELPDDVEYLDYKEVDLAELGADLIYVHNIFDANNIITMVDPDYFVAKLKTVSKKMVYIPYHIDNFRTYDKNAFAVTYNMFINSAVDYYATNSLEDKKTKVRCGLDGERFLPSGNPKIDYVRKVMKEDNTLSEWEYLKSYKKIFLLNTSILTFLRSGKDYLDFIEKTIDYLTKNNCAAIWRPHPLLKDTIIAMRPDLAESYLALLEVIDSLDNVVMDNHLDYKYSFSYADALISDLSSLCFLFIATDKPSFLVGREVYEPIEYKALEVVTEFMRFEDEGYFEKVESFIDNTINGIDSVYKERIESFQKSFANSDGTAGQELYRMSIDKILK